MVVHYPTTEVYKHRYRGSQIFRPKTSATSGIPSLVPSASENSVQDQRFHGRIKTKALKEKEHIDLIEPWRDEETRQLDQELVESFQQQIVDFVHDAICDIEKGNY